MFHNTIFYKNPWIWLCLCHPWAAGREDDVPVVGVTKQRPAGSWFCLGWDGRRWHTGRELQNGGQASNFGHWAQILMLLFSRMQRLQKGQTFHFMLGKSTLVKVSFFTLVWNIHCEDSPLWATLCNSSEVFLTEKQNNMWKVKTNTLKYKWNLYVY